MSEVTAAENAFDLDAYGIIDEFEYQVHADGKPDVLLPLKITLAGPAHPDYMNYLEGEFRKALKLREEADAARKEGKEPQSQKQTLDEIRQEQVAGIAARVLRANMPVRFRGELVTLNAERAKVILADPHYDWLAAQLLGASAKRENFSPSFAQKS